MKRFRLVIAATLLVGLALSQVGCGHERQLTVVIIDLSDGIETDARNKAFAELKNSELARGSTLILVPVTSDAQTETQGKILRFEQKLEAERKAYETDVREVAAQIEAKINQMQTLSESGPSRRSDILGATRVALEEIAAARGKYQKFDLIVLSDGIQHNAESKFETDPRLGSAESARTFGSSLARPDQLRGVAVKIGLLRSTDLRSLPPPRRDTIGEFWQAYFQGSGATEIVSVTDGPSAIRNRFPD